MKHTIKLPNSTAIVVEPSGDEVKIDVLVFGVSVQTRKADPHTAMALAGALSFSAEAAMKHAEEIAAVRKLGQGA